MIKKQTKKNLCLYVGSFLSVCIILLIIFKGMGIAPFGSTTLANYDGYIQYLDFFAWFKDVLAGKSDITYTFGKSLGGTNIAVFSYYLASPLNFLVVFFKKSQLNTFFDLLVMLKLGLAALTCSVWLNKRFENRIDQRWIYLLAIGYGLCQYNIAQSSNVMWLDGVVLLPLMLLGVYRGIWKKNWWYLSIFTAASILINWYVGCIDCVFTAIWVLAEMCLYVEENRIRGIKIWFRKAFGYILSMITGVLLSAILFWPSVKTLQGGRNNFDKEWLTNRLVGNIATVLPGFSAGAHSSFDNSGYVALFCGSLALVGCIGFFVGKAVRKKQKVILGVVLAVSVLIFYWQPFIFLFSLVRVVGSYWYRYSYLGVVGVIFCAAFFLQFLNKESVKNKKRLWILPVGTAIVSAGMLGVNHIYQQQNNHYVILSVVIMMVIAVLICVWQISTREMLRKNIVWAVICACVVGELGTSSVVLMKQYDFIDGAGAFKTYTTDQEKLIEEIQASDASLYRMTQLKNRLVAEDHSTSTYNEALALGYWSLSGYTSALDMNQAQMLEKFGYRLNGETYNIVNTSLLSADSLLGVKYILSDRALNGLELTEGINSYNGKETYTNPYALPLAFKYQGDTVDPEYYGNPFLYQNDLYSELLGEEIELYTPVEYEADGDVNQMVYTLKVLETESVLYGNLPWSSFYDGMLNINDSYSTGYAKWACPSVFDIPVSEGQETVQVTLSSAQTIDTYDEQFYALDLSVLQYVTDKLRAQEADSIQVEDGYVHIEATGSAGENLFTSIPADDGWSVTLNGETISPELFSDCLMIIPLQDGNNVIEMTYHVPGLRNGAIMTVAGCLLLLLEITGKKRKMKKK